VDRKGEVGVGREWNENLGWPRGMEGGVDFTWGWSHREKRRRGGMSFELA